MPRSILPSLLLSIFRLAQCNALLLTFDLARQPWWTCTPFQNPLLDWQFCTKSAASLLHSYYCPYRTQNLPNSENAPQNELHSRNSGQNYDLVVFLLVSSVLKRIQWCIFRIRRVFYSVRGLHDPNPIDSTSHPVWAMPGKSRLVLGWPHRKVLLQLQNNWSRKCHQTSLIKKKVQC